MPATAQWQVFGAHFGFVYALAMHVRQRSSGSGPGGVPGLHVTTPASTEFLLFSGSGDATIGVWTAVSDSRDLSLVRRLEGHTGSVYALVSAGANWSVRVWPPVCMGSAMSKLSRCL